MQRRELSTAFLQRLGDPGYRLPGEDPTAAEVMRARLPYAKVVSAD